MDKAAVIEAAVDDATVVEAVVDALSMTVIEVAVIVVTLDEAAVDEAGIDRWGAAGRHWRWENRQRERQSPPELVVESISGQTSSSTSTGQKHK